MRSIREGGYRPGRMHLNFRGCQVVRTLPLSFPCTREPYATNTALAHNCVVPGASRTSVCTSRNRRPSCPPVYITYTTRLLVNGAYSDSTKLSHLAIGSAQTSGTRSSLKVPFRSINTNLYVASRTFADDHVSTILTWFYRSATFRRWLVLLK